MPTNSELTPTLPSAPEPTGRLETTETAPTIPSAPEPAGRLETTESAPTIPSVEEPGKRLETTVESSKLERILLVALALIVLALVFNLRFVWRADDIWFREPWTPTGPWEGNFWDWMDWRTNNWTSRITIEALLFWLVRNNVIWWRFGTALSFWLWIVLPPWFITRNPRLRLILLPLSALLVASLPAVNYFDAGFMAASLNYLWPWAAGLVAAIPAVNYLHGRRQRAWAWPLVIVAALLAGSSELVSVFLVAFYALVLAWTLFNSSQLSGHSAQGAERRSRRIRWQSSLIPLAVLVLFFGLWVGYHLTNTGNAVRGAGRTQLPPLLVAENALSTTLRTIYLSGYLVPLAFFAAITWRLIKLGRSYWVVLFSLIPMAGSLILRDQYAEGTLGMMIINLFGHPTGASLVNLRDPEPITVIAFLILFALLVCTIISTCQAMAGSPLIIVAFITLAFGFASKAVVVTSIDNSSKFHRADLYLLAAFVIATLLTIAATILDAPLRHPAANTPSMRRISEAADT